MAVCNRYEVCSFLNRSRKDMPALTEILSRRLCRGDFADCAIHYVYNFIEGMTPEDSGRRELIMNDIAESLMPNEMARAKTVIDGTGSYMPSLVQSD